MIVFALLLPVTIGVVYVHCQKYIQKGPKYRADRLEQFSRMAVCAVAYESSSLSEPARKQLAISRTASLYTMNQEATPPVEAINIAVSAAMLCIPALGNPTTQKLSD